MEISRSQKKTSNFQLVLYHIRKDLYWEISEELEESSKRNHLRFVIDEK